MTQVAFDSENWYKCDFCGEWIKPDEDKTVIGYPSPVSINLDVWTVNGIVVKHPECTRHKNYLA